MNIASSQPWKISCYTVHLSSFIQIVKFVIFLIWLKSHVIKPIAKHEGFVDGNPEWSSYDNADEALKETVHLFPHKVKGEGHYVSLLKSDGANDNASTASRYTIEKYKGNVPEINDFLSHILSGIDKNQLEYRNDKLYLIPEG